MMTDAIASIGAPSVLHLADSTHASQDVNVTISGVDTLATSTWHTPPTIPGSYLIDVVHSTVQDLGLDLKEIDVPLSAWDAPDLDDPFWAVVDDATRITATTVSQLPTFHATQPTHTQPTWTLGPIDPFWSPVETAYNIEAGSLTFGIPPPPPTQPIPQNLIPPFVLPPPVAGVKRKQESIPKPAKRTKVANVPILPRSTFVSFTQAYPPSTTSRPTADTASRHAARPQGPSGSRVPNQARLPEAYFRPHPTCNTNQRQDRIVKPPSYPAPSFAERPSPSSPSTPLPSTTRPHRVNKRKADDEISVVNLKRTRPLSGDDLEAPTIHKAVRTRRVSTSKTSAPKPPRPSDSLNVPIPPTRSHAGGTSRPTSVQIPLHPSHIIGRHSMLGLHTQPSLQPPRIRSVTPSPDPNWIGGSRAPNSRS